MQMQCIAQAFPLPSNMMIEIYKRTSDIIMLTLTDVPDRVDTMLTKHLHPLSRSHCLPFSGHFLTLFVLVHTFVVSSFKLIF